MWPVWKRPWLRKHFQGKHSTQWFELSIKERTIRLPVRHRTKKLTFSESSEALICVRIIFGLVLLVEVLLTPVSFRAKFSIISPATRPFHRMKQDFFSGLVFPFSDNCTVGWDCGIGQVFGVKGTWVALGFRLSLPSITWKYSKRKHPECSN